MKGKIWLKVLGFLIGLYLLVASLSGPLVLEPLVKKLAPQHINGEVTAEFIFFNPLVNSLTVENLSVKNTEGLKLLELGYFYAEIDLLSLILLELQVNTIDLENLRLNINKESFDPWLTLPGLTVKNAFINLGSSNINIETININDTKLFPEIFVSGDTNIQAFLKEIEKLAKQADEKLPEKEQQSWVISINHFLVNNGLMALVDKSIDESASKNNPSLTIDGITISISNLKSDLSEEALLKSNIRLLAGTFSLDGKIDLASMNGEFSYSLNKIDLTGLNPYVEHYSFARIEGGFLDSDGSISITQETVSDSPKTNTEETEISVEPNDISEQETQEKEQDTQNILVTLTNNSSLENLSIKHQVTEESILGCSLLKIDDLILESKINSLVLKSIDIDTCQINTTLNKDGSNSFKLAKPQARAEKQAASENIQDQNNDPKPLEIAIESIRINDAKVTIKDLTQGEEVKTSISDIAVTVDQLKKGANDGTSLSISAKLNDKAPLTIKGNGNFLNPKLSASTKLTLDKLSLKAFSPYTLNLSSRRVEQGVLSLEIITDIIENEIKSENQVTIHGLKMGRKETIEGGGNLPIVLALTVLRDPDGTLRIDIPVEGNLDDPGFSIKKQILRTFTNIITKAATAPISLIGGVVSRDKTGTSKIIFEENAQLLSPELNKTLEKIASTLKKNPELAMEVKSYLSNNEALVLIDDQKTALMKNREKLLTEGLKNLGVEEAQLEITTTDPQNISDKPNLELRFFAR